MIHYANQLSEINESLISFKDYKDENRTKLLLDPVFKPKIEYKITCKKDYTAKVSEFDENSLQYMCYANSSFGELVGYICVYGGNLHLFFHLKENLFEGYHFIQTSDGDLENEKKGCILNPKKSEFRMPYRLYTKYESETVEKKFYESLFNSSEKYKPNFFIEITSIKQTDNFQILNLSKYIIKSKHTCLYYIFLYIYLIN